MRPCPAFLLALLAAGLAHAGPPQPSRATPATVFTGRWYEIARTPNLRERRCAAPTSDFTELSGQNFVVTQTCHLDTPTGATESARLKARIVQGSGGSRFRISLLGGLISQEYWVLDQAQDESWVILATPGGHFAWLFSRRPRPDPAIRTGAVGRLAALGFAPPHIEFPVQATPARGAGPLTLNESGTR